MHAPVVIVPGWTNSGAQHWQSLWQQAHPDWTRVEPADWDRPELDDWVDAIERAVGRCASAPLLVGHSLGCIAIAHWARRSPGKARGAFLVAPADVDAPGIPDEIAGFAPVPRAPLPFGALLVASEDDPYLALASAVTLASAWGAGFVNVGPLGHINAHAGCGAWPQGRRLFDQLCASLAPA